MQQKYKLSLIICMEEIEVIEYFLDEDKEDSGVSAISLVDEPAILSDWIMLSKTKVELKVVDEERRVLMGALLIPEQEIPRVDEDGKEFKIKFSRETIRKVFQKFMRKELQGNITLQHEKDITGDGFVTEIWEKEDLVHDKSVKFGFSEPVGTWYCLMKIESDEQWERAKKGEINGFSIEALFTDTVQQSKSQSLVDQLLKELEQELLILNK